MAGVPVIRELQRSELGAAADLVGSAMCTNPINVQAFGIADKHRRREALARFFVPVLHGITHRGRILAAFSGETLVGICAVCPPGGCQPGLREKLAILPATGPSDPSRLLRIASWTSDWSRRDLAEPHFHLGPVAVEPSMQGRGVGSAMLASAFSYISEQGVASYLETDKLENVRLYQRFGFSVIAEAPILGVQNWFMRR